MANEYNLVLTNSTDTGITVEESQVTAAYGLDFIGRHYEEYGIEVNQNLIYVLQHFAGDSAPSSPLEGQIWYDTAASRLKFYDGSSFEDLIENNYLILTNNVVSVDDGSNNVSFEGFYSGVNVPAAVTFANIATSENFLDHLNDTTSHASSAISYDPSTTTYTSSTNIQTAINNVYSGWNAHLVDTSAAHASSAISYSDGTYNFDNVVLGYNLNATNVDSALDRMELMVNAVDVNWANLETEITTHVNATSSAHPAGHLSFDNSGTGLSSTNVQSAIDEIYTTFATPTNGIMPDFARFYSNANQNIVAPGTSTLTYTKVLINATLFGDTFNNFSSGNNRYVADRNMIVRARAYGYMPEPFGTNIIHLRITRNGTQQGKSIVIRKPASGINKATVIEAEAVFQLNTGQYVEAEIGIHYGGGGNVLLQGGYQYTGLEIEVLREL